MSLRVCKSHAVTQTIVKLTQLQQHAQQSFQQPSTCAFFHSSKNALKPKKPGTKGKPKRGPPLHKKKNTPVSKLKPAKVAPPTSTHPPPPTSQSRKPVDVKDIDPQQLASEFIQFSAVRKQGSESIQELTQTQKLQNYGLALSLLGFVSWVWYYSMTSVGRSEGGMEQLLSEAEGAREAKAKQSLAEKEVEELVNAEMSLGSMDSTEEAMGGKGLVVAVAAPEDVARREEERNLDAAAKNSGGVKNGGRPLWKKIVFFWRRE